MNVEVRLFALARQLAGQAAVQIQICDGGTLADVRQELRRQCPQLQPVLSHATFSIDHEYATDSTRVPANAEIACIPPVSGG